jgi:dinuclear metal center YbgI/SA1388 family protein
MTIQNSNIIEYLKIFAPLELAEEWDNVGLILGRTDAITQSIMTCLTLTPDVAKEAIDNNISLIVSHHPILFRPVQKISSESSEGEMILSLIESGIAVYSPHTAFDSASSGINQFLAELLELDNIQVLRPMKSLELDESAKGSSTAVRGAGRAGNLSQSTTLESFLQKVKDCFSMDQVQYIGDLKHDISRVGIACGAAAEFMDDAQSLGCDLFLTGEARFHDCLNARTNGIAMILTGHYASERIAIEQLASLISKEFPSIEVWASKIESDPLEWI